MDAKSDKPFDSAAILSSVGLSRKVVDLEPEQSFFRQGDPADSVFCLQTGRAKLVVVSEKGKQATITLLSPGDFFGEESLRTVEGLRLATATAMNRCTAIKIKREEMTDVMHKDHDFSDQFLSYLLARSMRTQSDLVDLIFNSSERRLARMLLLMAETGKPDEPKDDPPHHAGDPGGDDRHHAIPRQLFHEPLSRPRSHQLQGPHPRTQIAAKSCAA